MRMRTGRTAREIADPTAPAAPEGAASILSAKSGGDQFPDAIGGTVFGDQPLEPSTIAILNWERRGSSGGGAVSGAAQVTASGPNLIRGRDSEFALSDGSTIIFASISDAGTVRADGALLLTDV